MGSVLLHGVVLMRSQEIPRSDSKLLTHYVLSHAIGWLAIHPYPSPPRQGRQCQRRLARPPEVPTVRVASGYLPGVILLQQIHLSTLAAAIILFLSSSSSSTAIVGRLNLIGLDSCNPLGTRNQSNPLFEPWDWWSYMGAAQF